MLWDDMKEMKSALFKIFGCDIIMIINAAVLSVAVDNGYGFMICALLVLAISGAFAAVVLFIRHYMREFHVTVRQIRIPLCIMIIPSVLLCVCRVISASYFKENLFCIVYFLMGMYVLMFIWTHKQMKSLPVVLRNMDPQIEQKCPEILRNDICRISSPEFLANMSDALDRVPKEKIDFQLQDAVSDWYSVYICLALMMEGTFMGMCVDICLTYL